MRRATVLIGVVVLIGLCVWAALAREAASGPPRTVEEQAQWIGDCYAGALAHYYGRYGLTSEAIETTRGDLVLQLEGVLEAPLDERQLSAISAWIFDSSASIGALDIAPPALRLRQSAAGHSDVIARYLSRPPLTRQQQDQIAGQLGVVLDELREAMREEYFDIPGVESEIRMAIYARAADFGRLIKDPLSPLIKRPYTAEEIEELCAYTWELAAGTAASVREQVAMLDPAAPDFEHRLAEDWTIQGVSWGLKSEVRGFQYTPPEVLSAEELEAMFDYYRELHGALWDDPEAMKKRVLEVPW